MASSAETEPAGARRIPRNLVGPLVSAFLEWFLILFLFVDAAISYVITRFARSCKLQTPCLLCSRLDHVLGKEKIGYHWDLMCKHHKSEISSLVHCHAHDKLVDVHKMCENCLFSFAFINKSNAETYRLLVGKLGEDFDTESDHEDSFVEDEKVSFMGSRTCACCNQPWAPRGHSRAKELVQTRIVGSEAGELERVLSGSLEHSVRDRSAMLTVSRSRQGERDHLPHIGYTELKINSDTESEAIHSDDDDHNDKDNDGVSACVSEDVGIYEGDDSKEEFLVQSGEPQIVIVNKDLALETLLDLVTEPRASLLESHAKEDEETIEVVGCKTREQEAQVNENEETIEFVANKIQERVSQVKEYEETIEFVDCKTREPESHEFVDSKAQELESQVKQYGETIAFVDCNAQEQESQVKEDEETIEFVDCKAREQESQVKEIEEAIGLVDCNAQEQESRVKEDEETIELVDRKAQNPVIDIGHGLEEINWQEVGNEADRITSPTETTIGASLLSDAMETIVEVSQNSYVETTIEVGETSVTKFDEVLEREALPNETAETSLETNTIAGNNALQVTTSLDLGDAYKLVVDTRGKQFSGVPADQWLVKDSSSRVTEDLKVLLSQLSANRGLELPISDISPKLSVNSDDTRSFDHSSSFGMQRLQKRISLERNESGLSMDGSIVSEIEGESAVDRLKRQVEHDKKLMSALYKELEEERSASAVATNQAMAMITRLQEEKAALHMEALQYLRMMEEQAEYDDEELQKSNDLLAEKEKEVQDLEAELEFYQKKFPNERYLESVFEPSRDIRIADIGVVNDNSDDKTVDSMIPEFEDEKTYILQALERLNKALHLGTNSTGYESSEEHDTSISGQDDNDNDKPHLVKQNSTESSQATDLASLDIVVSGLNKRLDGLEADRRFLEHTMSAFRNGEEGVQFVQEIATHLRELRKIAMRKDRLVA